MQSQASKPINIFLSWFHSLPVSQRQYIARLFFLCTTENSADFALSPAEALVRLENYILAPDFEVRKLSRLMIVRAVFDLILNNYEKFEALSRRVSMAAGQNQGENVASLSAKQWERTIASWRHFRSSVLTDKAIYLCLQRVL